MVIAGTPEPIGVSGPAYKYDIVILKLPIYILKPMIHHVGVL